MLGEEDTPSYLIVTVDHRVTPGRLIEQGNYRYVDADVIAERFADGRSGLHTLFFQVFDPLEEGIDDIDASFAAVAERGLRLATFHELLAVAAARPDQPPDGHLIAAGSTWLDERIEPRLYAVAVHAWNGRRHLDLQPLYRGWRKGERLLCAPRD